jgi:hypothetical protein
MQFVAWLVLVQVKNKCKKSWAVRPPCVEKILGLRTRWLAESSVGRTVERMAR